MIGRLFSYGDRVVISTATTTAAKAVAIVCILVVVAVVLTLVIVMICIWVFSTLYLSKAMKRKELEKKDQEGSGHFR